MQYGIVLTASQAPGYKFTNLFLESLGSLGQAAVQVRTGGSLAPKILINGVSEGGPLPWGRLPVSPSPGRRTGSSISCPDGIPFDAHSPRFLKGNGEDVKVVQELLRQSAVNHLQ